MAYGDYNGPDKANKGHEGGACNRGRCQAEPALWYNHGSYSWYCVDCARDIGEDVVNRRDWMLRWEPSLGHPQFETREQMDAREVAEPPKPPVSTYPPEYVTYPKMSRKQPQSAALQRMLGKPHRRAIKGVR